MSARVAQYPLPIRLGDAAFPESQERADRCAGAIREALDEAAKVARTWWGADHGAATCSTCNCTPCEIAAAIEALKERM